MLTFDGALEVIAAAFDGLDAQVIVYGVGYVPDGTHTRVSDVTEIVARTDVTLAAAVVSSQVEVTWEEDAEVDIDAEPIVGGWVLALDGATDADRVLVNAFADPGGTPPDPYPVVVAGAVLIVEKP